MGWGVAFAALVVLQGVWHWTPPYHDALTNWDAARALRERPWLPFLMQGDTGHPPLVAWVFGVLARLLPGEILLMHLMSWAAGGLLVGAVGAIGWRIGGRCAGLAAALLTFTHPVIFAQSLQFNLDLYLAAFSWLAVWAAIEGRSRLLGLALTLAAFSKLNGVVSLVPFLLMTSLAWRREGRPTWRQLLPLVVPVVLLVLYHAIKWPVSGHLFDSGEFENGRQLALVASASAYVHRLHHSAALLLQHNGSLVLLAMLIALGLAVASIPTQRRACIAWLGGSTSDAHGPLPPWQPRARREALLLALAMAGAHLLVHALRDRLPLVRYFVVCQPALVLVFVSLTLHAAPRRPGRGAVLLAVPLVLLFALKVHPAMTGWMPPSLRERLANPPTGILTNHENSLEFVEILGLLREAAPGIEEEALAAPWPFHRYLYDTEFGVVPRAFAPPPVGSGSLLVFSTDFTGEGATSPGDVPPPQGYHQATTWQRGRTWIALMRPDAVRPGS